MTATRSAAISSCSAARCQNCAMDSTRGLPGRSDRSAWPGPVIISASAATVLSRVSSAHRPRHRRAAADLGDLTVITVMPTVVGHPPQVLAPPPVGGRRPAAVHPFGELAGRDQVGLPAVPGHPLVEFGVAPRHQRRTGTESRRPSPGRCPAGAAPSVQPPRGLPVGRRRGAFDRDHVGRVDAHGAQFGGLGGDRDGLGARADDGQRVSACHAITSRSASCHIACSVATSSADRMSGRVRHWRAQHRRAVFARSPPP